MYWEEGGRGRESHNREVKNSDMRKIANRFKCDTRVGNILYWKMSTHGLRFVRGFSQSCSSED